MPDGGVECEEHREVEPERQRTDGRVAGELRGNGPQRLKGARDIYGHAADLTRPGT